MYDFAEAFLQAHEGAEFEDLTYEMIHEAAIQPTFDAETFAKAKHDEQVELIVADLKAAYARRAKLIADTVRPVMERIYEDRKDQLDSNIYFPITDGHLGYNVPVNLLRCKETDLSLIHISTRSWRSS